MACFLFSLSPRQALCLQMKSELGFKGRYIIGSWTPLRVLLENENFSFEGYLRIKVVKKDILEKNSVEVVYSLPVSLPPSSRKVYQVNVLLEPNVQSLQILIESNGKTFLEEKINIEPFYQRNKFILVINKTRSGFDFLNPTGAKIVRQVLYPDLDELPDKWIGYDAVQAIILDDISSLELTLPQKEALKKWLFLGGMLIITARGGYGKFKSSFVQNVLPIRYLERTKLPFPPESLQKKYGPFKEDGKNFDMIEVWNTRWEKAHILISEKNVPLLVKVDAGQGDVFFLGFDFFQPPFRKWEGLYKMWTEILKREDTFYVFPRGFLDSIITSVPWQEKLYPGRGKIALFLLFYFVSFVGLFCLWAVKKEAFFLNISLLIFTGVVFLIISYSLGIKMQEKNTSVKEVSICYGKENVSFAKAESYFSLFSPCSRHIRFVFNEKGFVSAILPSRQNGKLFTNLRVQLDKREISWNLSSTLPWSFYFFRIETVYPIFLQTKLERKKDYIKVKVKNLNSFSLQDLLLLYKNYSFFLKDLPPLKESDLVLDLQKENISFNSGKYIQEIAFRREKQKVKLRERIFRYLWEFEGPLKELSTKFPVLLVWFNKPPEEIIVASNFKVNHNFTGLLILPLKFSNLKQEDRL